MSIIARSEAIQRLHIIATNVRAAMEAVRADEWEESVLRAEMALDQLQKLTPWLEEASNNAPARPNVATQQPIGGMGYRGSTGTRVETINPSNVPEVLPMPNRTPPEPLVAPKPAPTPRKPIVTPPPPLPQLPEAPVTFDLARMSGQDAYYRACMGNSLWPPLTDAEWEATERFDRLPTELQTKIKTEYERTGKPVTVRLRSALVAV